MRAASECGPQSRGCPQTSIRSVRYRAHGCVFSAGWSRRFRGHAQGRTFASRTAGPTFAPGGLTSPNEAVSPGPGGGPGGSSKSSRQQGPTHPDRHRGDLRGRASSPVRRLRPRPRASRDPDARGLAQGAECTARSDPTPSMVTDIGRPNQRTTPPSWTRTWRKPRRAPPMRRPIVRARSLERRAVTVRTDKLLSRQKKPARHNLVRPGQCPFRAESQSMRSKTRWGGVARNGTSITFGAYAVKSRCDCALAHQPT